MKRKKPEEAARDGETVPKRRRQPKKTDIPDGMQKEYFTVKCGLLSRCFDEAIYHRILVDVHEMSRLLVEFSIYTHYILNKNWESGIFKKICFLDYFYALSAMGKRSRKTVSMDTGYSTLRGKNIKELHDRTGKSNVLVFAAKHYETIFNNNIWMHGYNRVRKFLLNFTADKNTVYYTLDYLFNEKSTRNTDPDLIRHLVQHLQYDGKRFLNIKTDPHIYIKFFYELQRFNNANDLHNFALVPIKKHGLHHIQYDTQAFHTMLRAIEKKEASKEATLRKSTGVTI